jgi:hypothetical protein
MALAAALTLGACDEARGGGYLGAPTDGEAVGIFTGRADFGFTFQCTDGIKGQITYHDDPSQIKLPGESLLTAFPEIKIHGEVDTVLVDADDDPSTEVEPVKTCEELIEAPVAQFEGKYRSQDSTHPGNGKFNVLVFDQGEPGRTSGEMTGDGFSIELFGDAPYGGYTRAGYIEGGNIQVDE